MSEQESIELSIEEVLTRREEDLRQVTADLMVRIEEARKSPLGVYKMLFTDEQGQPYVIKDFHIEWNDLVLQEDMLIICAARELTKTSFMISVASWMIGNNPDIRITWLGPDNETAWKRLSVIHSVIDAPIFRWIFPNCRKLTARESKEEKRPNSVSTLNVKRDFRSPEPTMQACGILTSGIGARSDALICDDVVSESNALLNPSLRPKVISKFLSDWLNTLVADGKVLYIGTPWHKDDLLGHLKKQAGWAYQEYRHGKPDDIYFSRFPERWPPHKLKQRRATLGPLHYARAYLCEAFHSGTVAVKPSSLIPYTTLILTREKLLRAQAVISVDPSSGRELQKGKLDYTGVTVLFYIPAELDEEDNRVDPNAPPFEIIVPEAYQVKMPHVFQAKLVWQLAKFWNAGNVIIEAVGMQSLDVWLEEQRRLDPTLPLCEIEGISSGNVNKGQRLIRITPLLEPDESSPTLIYMHPQLLEENPQTYMMEVGGVAFEAMRDLRGQLIGFPTEHDDILDSFTYGVHGIHTTLVEAVGIQDSEEGGVAISCVTI